MLPVSVQLLAVSLPWNKHIAMHLLDLRDGLAFSPAHNCLSRFDGIDASHPFTGQHGCAACDPFIKGLPILACNCCILLQQHICKLARTPFPFARC
mmetsp:Transcript_10438/g.20176  ORF Transcript_10438/g.20176 Transcript_10438/m.20176 type:complete len:96 (-) Transcript_10438:265-552(-)